MLIRSLPCGLAESLALEAGLEATADNVEARLRAIGVALPNERIVRYRDLVPWRRAGGETFQAVGELEIDGKGARRCVAKALVSFAMAPEQQVKVWSERRTLLQSKGVRVPHVFSEDKGTVYEEFIDDALDDVRPFGEAVIRSLGSVAGVLDGLRFAPLAFLGDLRVRGDDVYYVDFGADLGGPGQSESRRAWNELAASLGAEELAIAKAAYDERLN